MRSLAIHFGIVPLGEGFTQGDNARNHLGFTRDIVSSLHYTHCQNMRFALSRFGMTEALDDASQTCAVN